MVSVGSVTTIQASTAPEPHRAREGLITLASHAAKGIREAGLDHELEYDLDKLRVGLREALDAARLFRLAQDRGVSMSGDLLIAMESLLQATFDAQPLLTRLEMNTIAAIAAGEDDGGEQSDFTGSLRRRCMNAGGELLEGLKVGYRALIDEDSES